MCDHSPDISLSLDLDDVAAVTLRREGISDHKKERTPTVIVSDAFTFLNDHQISIVDAVEEGILDEQICKDVASCGKECASEITASETEGRTLVPQTDCHSSKDSGFASLERHLHSDDFLSCEAHQDDFSNSNSVSQGHISCELSSKNSTGVDSHINVHQDKNCIDFQNTREKNDDIGCIDLKDTDNLYLDKDLTNTPENDLEINVKGSDHFGSCSMSNDNNNRDYFNETGDLKPINVSNEISSNDTNFRMDLCVNNLKQEYSRNEITSQNEIAVQKALENTMQFNHIDDSCACDRDSNAISKTGYDIIVQNCDNEKSSCDLTKEIENISPTLSDTDTEGNVRANEGFEDGNVKMRKKSNVIPASPVKVSSFDTVSSKTGMLLEANPATELVSDDSSDEDTGIYAESIRRSNWIRVSQDRKHSVKKVSPKNTPLLSTGHITLQSSTPGSSNNTAPDGHQSEVLLASEGNRNAGIQDEVFTEPLQSVLGQKLCHKRSDSVTTTDSELEFKTRYISRRKCLIQRADSQQEYHRLSARIYEQDKEVTLERSCETEDLGLHLLDSHPTYITSVDADSPAEKAGILEGQILVTVNDFNVLLTDHDVIIKLIQDCKGPLKLGVASTDFQPIRDLQAPVISGHMYKLGSSSLVRIWKKRFFVLRNDNCLYYYKSDQDLDPLGALPLAGYTISRHTDTSKDFCFKAEKYRARTYYFMTENRDQLTEWVAILTESALRSKKQKESSSFMSVSSHNVSLPALDIRRPECSGYLIKLSPHSRSWRRRYCLLKDACIYYYKDVNSFSALGVAHLHGYTVDVAGHAKKKNSFSLQPPDAKMRQFIFGADNETDKKRWVEAIIHSIQRWVPVGKGSEC